MLFSNAVHRVKALFAVDASLLHGTTLVVIAYLVGAIPFGLVVSGIYDRSIDIRKVGSGNIGATNVARTLGKGAGALTLLLDAGKAILVLALTRFVMGASADIWLALVGGAAFLGHVFPVYLRFKGGKGVATALGIVLFLSPVAALALMALFFAALLLVRYVSVGSICAAAGLPVLMVFLEKPRPCFYLALLIFFVVIISHRQNIHRLLTGREPRFGFSKKAA